MSGSRYGGVKVLRVVDGEERDPIDAATFVAVDEVPRYEPRDPLDRFARWFLAQPIAAMALSAHGINADDGGTGVISLTLFEAHPFSVQLIICKPGCDIPDLEQPEFESFAVCFGGAIQFRRDREPIASPARFEPRNEFGATTGPEGGAAFLSIRRWLTDALSTPDNTTSNGQGQQPARSITNAGRLH